MNSVTGIAGSSAAPVRVFLSWAHADRRAKEALFTRLEPHVKALTGVRPVLWQDAEIPIGEDWHQHIKQQLERCEYGLLLLSPAFFASPYIRTEELPTFVGPQASKLVLPVGLRHVPIDGSRDTRGVERHQIFTDRPTGRWFTDLDAAGKDRFACDLADAIRNRLMGDR